MPKFFRLLLLATLIAFIGCAKKQKIQILDVFNKPIPNAELRNDKDIFMSDNSGYVSVHIPSKDGNVLYYSIKKDGYYQYDISLGTKNSDKINLLKRPNSTGIFFLNKKESSYLNVPESDFRIESVDPGFSWDGPIMYSYYYPFGEPFQIKKTEFIGLLISLKETYNFYKVLEEGYFVKVTKFWTADPKTETSLVSSNSENYEGVKLFKELSKGSYFISNKGLDLGNLSSYAQKPCYYFKITE